uniref:Uncharacterized protein AlNc14C10G1309 n=1 Tax=Albugo laibachii Nc14 TaxID=890382 RepID=F0W2S3_9STRA|nr:conserved hypothetical protein [Albugo laibachii Nc14]|eukprot:CCA15359.1 conserved hypothetical protein [Albugo laibachii Nc14]
MSANHGQEQEKLQKPVYNRLDINATNAHAEVAQYRSVTIPQISHSTENLAMPCMKPPTLSSSTHSKEPIRNPNLDSVSTRKDSTSYVDVSPRRVPPPPFRLEAHTHFNVKRTAVSRLCTVIGTKLCELDTDFKFNVSKCKWKVAFRQCDSTQRASFNIVLWTNETCGFVVEVQRRDGDMIAFMEAYAELKSTMKRNQLVAESSNSVSSINDRMPKNIDFVNLPHSENAHSDLKCISGMLDSKFEDIQLQGLFALLSFPVEESVLCGLVAVIPRILSCGQSRTVNVAKVAHAALSKFCHHADCRTAVINSGNWSYLIQNAAGGTMVDPEIQRASLHVVGALSPHFHQSLLNSDDKAAQAILQLVQRWESIDDPRLKTHAFNANLAFQKAGILA